MDYTAPTSESELLQQCPWCGYALTGLPVEHRCPECGQGFDRRWRVFGGKPRYGSRCALLCVTSLLLLTAINFWRDNGTTSFWWRVLNLLVFTAPMYPAIKYCLARPPEFVAVGPDGITLVERKKNLRHNYRWFEVGEAEMNWRNDAVFLLGEMETTVNAWFGNVREAEACVEYVNQCRERLGLDVADLGNAKAAE